MAYQVEGLYLACLGTYAAAVEFNVLNRMVSTARVHSRVDQSWLLSPPNHPRSFSLELLEMNAAIVSIDKILVGLSTIGIRQPATLAETLAVLAATPQLIERSFPFLSLGSMKRNERNVTVPWIESCNDYLSIDVLEQDENLWGHYLLFGVR